MKGFIGGIQTAVCIQEVFMSLEMLRGTLRKALEYTTPVSGGQ